MSKGFPPGPGLLAAALFLAGKFPSRKRSLPELSAEAKSAWPDASSYVFPYTLPIQHMAASNASGGK